MEYSHNIRRMEERVREAENRAATAHMQVPRRKWLCATTRLTSHFMCDLMSDLVYFKHRKEYGHK